MKCRLDQLLVNKGLIESRTKAKALILAGEVLVDNTPVDKTGTLVSETAELRIKQRPKYVSRGGIKLEKALSDFNINVTDKVAVDVGASTGGFTDCLLRHGAAKVYAVDVGYGQMHWSLQGDTRVVRIDRQNFRNIDINLICDPVDIVVMDVSFISIKLLIPKITALFNKPHSCQHQTLIALIKPQFEVGRENIGKGGIVKSVVARERVLNELIKHISDHGFINPQTVVSPITGADGNIEYLLCAPYKNKLPT
ncbi:MAG: TlyA family RNA methyltransferase [Deltaproteobacteria bacterium]|nr:TlyA family RNA methyltransferase [Deltaproteobacteria bacterium]